MKDAASTARRAAHRKSANRILGLCLCATALGCAMDVAVPGEELDQREVASSEQPLAGFGATFWMPERGEHQITLYYCFTNFGSTTASARDYVARGITQWTAYSNVRFVNDGDCASSTRSSIKIEPSIWGWSAFGTTSLEFSPSMSLPMFQGAEQLVCKQTGFLECLRLTAGHEFGHALGFQHESFRSDAGGSCPNDNPAGPEDGGEPPDTTLTPYDPDSLLDVGYCRAPTGSPTLTQNDIAGLGAIYGRGTPTSCPAPYGCAYAKYGSAKHAIRFQNSRQWLMPTDWHGVQQQTFIGSWERITFERLAGPNDGFVHYGDVIAVRDQWNYALSGRDNSDVTMMPNVAAWERWVVETPDAGRYPIGSKVLINAPLRLRSEAHNRRLEVSSSGDVRLTSATSTSHLRINGPFI